MTQAERIRGGARVITDATEAYARGELSGVLGVLGTKGVKAVRHKRGRVYQDRNDVLWRGSNRETLYPILPTGERVPGSLPLRFVFVERRWGPLSSADVAAGGPR